IMQVQASFLTDAYGTTSVDLQQPPPDLRPGELTTVRLPREQLVKTAQIYADSYKDRSGGVYKDIARGLNEASTQPSTRAAPCPRRLQRPGVASRQQSRVGLECGVNRFAGGLSEKSGGGARVDRDVISSGGQPDRGYPEAQAVANRGDEVPVVRRLHDVAIG